MPKIAFAAFTTLDTKSALLEYIATILLTALSVADLYQESFYSKLKKFADECNTNLYVSNIPKNMNEHELASIFAPHKVCSSRILRDSSGTGRGVGFAR